MLSVLAVIGKIIGFTLLGILGLLLLILLIALFVPLRYKVDANGGKFEEGVKVDAKGAASYLLHAISVKGGFLKTPNGDGEDAGERAAEDGRKGPEAEGVTVLAKLLGIQVYPKKEKKGKKKDKAEESAADDFEEAEILEVITAEGPKEEPAEAAEAAQPEQTLADRVEAEMASLQKEDDVLLLDEAGPLPEKPVRPKPETQDDEDWKDLSLDDLYDYAEELPEEESEKEKKTLSEKIEGIRQKGEDLADKWEAVKAKIDKVLDFVQDNTTQEEFSLILKRLGKMAKHYIPKKFEGYTRVGLSDPATTGKILMYWYAIAYPRLPDTFRLIGDFDEEVIEGDVHVKGHLRLCHIVWFGIKMLLDKRFRKLLKRGKKLAKELKGFGAEDQDEEDETDDKEKKKGKKAKKNKKARDDKDNKNDNQTTKEEE